MNDFSFYIFDKNFNILFVNLLLCISIFTPSFLMFRLTNNTLGYKSNIFKKVSLCILYVIVWKFSNTVTSAPFPIYIGYLFILLMVFFLCLGDNLSKFFFSMFLQIYLTLGILLWHIIFEIISIFCIISNLKIDLGIFLEYDFILPKTCLGIMIFILLFLILNKNYHMHIIFSLKHTIIVFGLSIINLFFIYTALSNIMAALQSSSNQSAVIVLLSIFLSLLTLAYSFYSFKKIESISFDKLALSSKVIEQTVQLEYFAEIEASTSVLRKWNHDFAQHMEVINTLAQNGAYMELGNYVSKLKSSVHKFNFILDTGFKTVDAVISQKIILSEGKGITFTKQIIFPSDFAMSQTDFCIILSNLLDNAIESCAKLSDDMEKYIDLSIRFNDDMLFISIKNSSMGDHIKYDGYFLTTKIKDAALHGIGLRRVVELATLNKGICNFEAGDNSFTASLALPLREDL